ncbi:hypothetical protein ACERII_25260 [Evansella sp. AB-rgal1]|uniref:hypothetical protein n=1 Tax=Evansella sp. AB-rgal1 TaxID=3242696 RepID=UPI00359D3150
MYLLISIIICTLIGFLLIMMSPLIGGVIAFGLVLGCLVRGLYLLNLIYNQVVPQKDKVQSAYDDYLEEREKSS